MPSGRTHDRLAWWTSAALFLATGTLWRWDVACWAGAGSLFGGLMFSGDLDTVSRPLKRWGWLRWLWWPYRKLVPHRGTHSHGLVWGPVFRSVYLFVLVTVLVVLVQVVLRWLGMQQSADLVRTATGHAAASLATVPAASLGAFAVGLVFANAVHSLSDWTVSGAKRVGRRRSRRR
jgi:uncharacterized metal-binding protein